MSLPHIPVLLGATITLQFPLVWKFGRPVNKLTGPDQALMRLEEVVLRTLYPRYP